MYLTWVAYFAAAVAIVLVLNGRWRVHPFAAVVLGAAAYALTSGISTNYIARAFEIGFGQEVAALGLVVVLGAVLAEVAERARIAPLTFLGRRPLLVAVPAVIAGVAASAAAAFAILAPLVRGAAGPSTRAPLALGLGLSVGHGLLLPSPVMLATATILAADWRFVALFGVPVAAAAAAAGTLWARLLPEPPQATFAAAAPVRPAGGRRALVALALTVLVLLVMLVVQSLGDIASEPFGGGQSRERLFAFGRPTVLLVVGAALVVLLSRMHEPGGLTATGWLGRALLRAAPLVFVVGAAGGFMKVLQETGIAEMNAERFLAMPLGILVPFLAAATVKTLQGSSLVAAITAAGMVQPMLGLLGLDGAAGAALAALAVGAGAMTVSHVNGGLFWLVADAARLRAPGAFLRFSLGTLVQGVVAIALLALAAAAIG